MSPLAASVQTRYAILPNGGEGSLFGANYSVLTLGRGSLLQTEEGLKRGEYDTLIKRRVKGPLI